eukprot:3854500-Amphidinium_carterae.1
MWAEVRARINRVDAVATRKMIPDKKLEAVLNKEYARLRPTDPIPGIGDDEDFGNVFESAGTISILMRNLRIIRGILIALIETLPRAESEKFWKWEPGFGYQKNGKITTESQTINFGPEVASSPMEMNTPRASYDDTPAEGVRKFAGPQNRASSVGSLNRPRSPKPQRSSSRTRGEASGDTTPRTSGDPTSFGPDSAERSRSARRQKPEEAEAEPQGGDDMGDQVDFSAEEAPQDQPPDDEFLDDDDIPLYAERIHAEETRVRVQDDEIQSPSARPRLLEEMPPWWETLQRFEPSGGITREMIRSRTMWDHMESAVREAGYIAITMPMLYEPNPMKARHVAHGVRKEAIIEVINDMGMKRFEAAIDYQIKSGETIEWDDPVREGVVATTEVETDTKLNTFVRLKLPTEIERDVVRRSEEIAARRPGRRVQAKVDEAFNSFSEIYSMRLKSHEGAVKHGFPSYAQRWFERPIYRYQQVMLGLGPLFCVSGRFPGEPTSASQLNRAWMLDMLSPDGRQAAETYLEIINDWNKHSIQGKPIAPMGVRASQYKQDERYKMFKNDSGLVPTHLPWVIRDAVEWMKRHPCASNVVPTVVRDEIDHYGRQLQEGTVDMKFYYLAEGREVGEMTYQDFWFEKRNVPDLLGFGGTRHTDVMVTTLTAKRSSDPYNGTGNVEQPTGEWIR